MESLLVGASNVDSIKCCYGNISKLAPDKTSCVVHIPPRKQLGDFGPAVSQQRTGFVDDEVFFVGPGRLLDMGAQVVVPALTTLFPQPAREFLGNDGPFRSVFAYEFDHLCRAKIKRPVLFPIIKSLLF